MPKDFTDCVKAGGRVVTKQLKNDKYIHICYDKDGNAHSGEVKTKKDEASSKQKNISGEQKLITDAKKLLESLAELQKHYNENHRA